MPKCEHYEICGRDARVGTDEGLCILHSDDSTKTVTAFDKALAEHREKKGDNFSKFVFPEDMDFSGATFKGAADFSDAKFVKGANFLNATFCRKAKFDGATFKEWSEFVGVTFGSGAYFATAKFHGRTSFTRALFKGWTDFSGAEFAEDSDFVIANFHGGANFSGATFTKPVHFGRSTFTKSANFQVAVFSSGANYYATTFTQWLDFSSATFLGRTIFAARQQEGKTFPIFSSVEVDFRNMIVEPLDALVFRDADLCKCRFEGTDLRKAEFANVTWPQIIGKNWPEFVRKNWPSIGKRLGVYDEIDAEEKGETDKYPHIEQLYRQLKQNYEDRKDYGRAGDFHYGEKEMRRRNPETSWGLWLWLTLYWLVSGYGERWFRPLLWTAIVLVGSTFSYLWWGLLRLKEGGPLDCARIWETGLYSLKVMILLKPSNFEPSGFEGDAINTLQSIFGPILIGLFALAIRQKLKR